MGKHNNLYERFKMGLLFVAVPVGFYVVGYVLYFYLPHVNPCHVMAYGMQMGAFIVFMRRVNLIYKFNHPQNKNIWEAIKISISPPVTEGSFTVTVKDVNGNTHSTGSTQVETIKVGDVEKMLIAHNKRLNQLESSVYKLPNQIDEKVKEVEKTLRAEITALEKKKNREEQVKAKFDKKNAGPEFVAVLWLLIAAFTFLGTHIWE